MLTKYYDTEGHQRRNLTAGGSSTVQDLKRDIHGLIAAKTNLNLAEVADYGGKTFLSDDVAIMLIQVLSVFH